MWCAQLVVLVPDADDDGTTTPARLDLTGCRNTTPTDIMKRARKTQRHLFPHLAPLGAKSAAKVADGNRKDLLTLQQAEIEPAEGAHCRAGRGKRVLARAAGRGDDMRLLPKKEPGRELVPLDDVIGNLPFIVRRDHRIVAAFFQESRGP